jgi:hypothetical protein
MVGNEIEDQLEAIAERAIAADTRSSDNAKQLNEFKKVNDGQQILIDKALDSLHKGKEHIEALQEVNQAQARDITSLKDILEAHQRLIDTLTDRLNGKGLLQVDPYERIVATVREHADALRGGEGQLSFSQVRNSIQNTQFLGKVMYGAIGLFGIGGVMAAGLALFGVDKIPPEVQALQQKVTDLRGDIDKLQSEWNADIQRRLSEAGKK